MQMQEFPVFYFTGYNMILAAALIILFPLVLANGLSYYFLGTSALYSTSAFQDSGTRHYIFENKSSNFSIEAKYPYDWEEVKTNFSDNIVVFRPKPDNSSDKLSPGVGIYVRELPYRNVPLSEYSTTLVDLLESQSFNILSSNSTSLSKSPAYQAVYLDSTKVTTGLQIWTIKNDYVYTIMYLANSKQFADFLPYADSIIDSFKIIPSNTTKHT